MTYNIPHVKLSNPPEKAAQEMMIIINQLQYIYQQETGYLAVSDTVGFQSIQDTKMQATLRYEQGMSQMFARRSELKLLSDATKETLRTMEAEFKVISMENKKMLERVKRTTERLGETIRYAAKDAVKKRTSAGYSATGIMSAPSSRNMSIGISETI